VAGRGIEWVRVDAGGGETVLHREAEDSRGAGRALVTAAPVLDEARAVAYFVANRERTGRLIAWSLRDARVEWMRELPAAIQATPTVLPNGRGYRRPGGRSRIRSRAEIQPPLH
jgi:hypothetical protein